MKSVAAEAQMPFHPAGPTMADMLWLDSEPTSKAQLARSLAHMYKYQEEHGALPLPSFDEFLAALARPRWTWTPQASTLFRRIGSIIRDSRRSIPEQLTLRAGIRELMHIQRRRAALRRRNIDRLIAIGRERGRGFRSNSVVNN